MKSISALLPVALALAATAVADPYRIAATYPVGGTGSYDYIRFDGAGHRLFASHQTRVEVLDADSGKLLGAITGLHGVHGIALAPSLKKGFITNGTDGTVTVFDLGSLAVTGSIVTGGQKPDAIEYDPSAGLLIVSNGRSNQESLINAASGQVAHLVALAGNPESIGFDGRGHALVNLESHNSVAVIALDSGRVLADWPLSGGEGPTGLAVDLAGRRLIVTCGGNGKLIVLDLDNGHPVTVLPIGDDSDGAAFDPVAHQAFSSNRDGTLTVVQEDDPNHFRVLENLKTEPVAKTLAVDSVIHRIFLPVAQHGPSVQEDHPGPVVPGTFKILVVK